MKSNKTVEIKMKNEYELVPSKDEMHTYEVMAKKAATTPFFSKIGGEAAIFSIMIMARELGIPPMQAVMGGMNVIQGKVELSPRLMNQMIRKEGHILEIMECSDTACKIKGVRHDTQEEYIGTYTIDEAKKAGLLRPGGGWEKYPSDMLFARALSRLARRLFADVISSAYIEGEIGDTENTSTDRKRRGNTYSEEETLEVVNPAPAIVEQKKAIELKDFEVLDKLIEICGKDNVLKSPISLSMFLDHIVETKGLKRMDVINQALDPRLSQKFCNSWKQWDETNPNS